MLKITSAWNSFICLSFAFFLSTSAAYAGYDRNQAVPVEKVLYGSIESIKHVTESELREDSNRGWTTFGGALLGGVIGHQFGGGSGRKVATVLGALIGGRIGHQSGSDNQYYVEHKLIELMINQDDGTQVMVIQDLDPGMSFNAGDEVRVVYLQGYVRVDLAM